MIEWIENIKEGDLVFVNYRYKTLLKKVKKITPAGYLKVNGALFNSSGHERGGSTWDKGYLSEATPEALEEFRKKLTIKKALRLMKETKEITIEQANEIVKILECKQEEGHTL